MKVIFDECACVAGLDMGKGFKARLDKRVTSHEIWLILSLSHLILSNWIMAKDSPGYWIRVG